MRAAAANHILDFADALPGPYGFERSCKFTPAGVNRQRFLVTFPKLALELGADLNGLLERLAFPASHCPPDLLNQGDILHLGVDGNELSSDICKLYVEDAARVRQLWQAGDMPVTEAVPLHRAIKWIPGRGTAVETEYHWLPCYSVDDVLTQVQRYTPEFTEGFAALLALAVRHCAVADLQLLRVSERQGQRLSLDLNLYDAQLTMAQIWPRLQAFEAQVASLAQDSDWTGEEIVGHLACGKERSGDLFVTLYYGACERGGFQ